MKDRLIELWQEADKKWNAYFENSLLKGETRSKSYKEFIADHILANGVVVLDTKIVTPQNRPLITQIAGMPINDVLDLLRAKKEGRLIVTPCKVGQTVYIIENPYTFVPLKKAVDGEVVSIHLHEHGLYLRVLFDTKKINGCQDYNLNWRLGKTIFLTKEEAEAELQKRGKENA